MRLRFQPGDVVWYVGMDHEEGAHVVVGTKVSHIIIDSIGDIFCVVDKVDRKIQFSQDLLFKNHLLACKEAERLNGKFSEK